MLCMAEQISIIIGLHIVYYTVTPSHDDQVKNKKDDRNSATAHYNGLLSKSLKTQWFLYYDQNIYRVEVVVILH